VIRGTTTSSSSSSSSSNALMHALEILFGWTPVNLGFMYFNEQGYNWIGDLLTIDDTKIDEMKVSVKSVTKNVSMKVKKQIRNILSYCTWKASELSSSNMIPEDWLLLSIDEFETFCNEVLTHLTFMSKSIKISSSHAMTASGVTNADMTDFDHGLKRGPKSYVEFHG
jgi:hypothetical protein